jgi:hypothetical protein
MLELYLENNADFDRRYTEAADELEREVVARIGKGLDGPEALSVLREHMDVVESRMTTILATHSRLFWLHLSRRVPPKPLYEATAWTTSLYRLVFALALMKHALPYGEVDDMDISSGTLQPRTLTHEDHVAIYQVEQLAIEFNFAAASYRRVAKGAALRQLEPRGFGADADDELESLIASIDGRVGRFTEILSPFGSTADVDLDGPTNGGAYDSILTAQLNVIQAPWPEELLNNFGMSSKDDPLSGTPNYLLGWIDLPELRPVMRAFEEQIRDLTALTVDELLAFLWALGWRHYLAMTKEPFAAYQFMQRGYWLTTAGDRFENTVEDTAGIAQIWWKNVIREDLSDDRAVDLVRRGYEALTYSDEELRGIDLWSKAPRKPILREGEFIVWDYSAFAHYFRSLFEQIGSLTGEVGNVKGENFEDEVAAAVAKHAELSLWAVRRKLKTADGVSREVDVSFIAGDTLYLAECKAVSAHPRVDRSEPDVLARRWEKMVEYLGQADSLRQFLIDNPHGTNYAVPDGVKEIRACICTPMPEYIPSRDPDLWLSADVPRVCVPGELVQVALETATAAARS